jgi:hypothetical protein
MEPPSGIKSQIARQIFIALQKRGVDKLLSTIESYGDTLTNAEILRLLEEYNATGEASHLRQ